MDRRNARRYVNRSTQHSSITAFFIMNAANTKSAQPAVLRFGETSFTSHTCLKLTRTTDEVAVIELLTLAIRRN
jgi:hypothetical protein